MSVQEVSGTLDPKNGKMVSKRRYDAMVCKFNQLSELRETHAEKLLRQHIESAKLHSQAQEDLITHWKRVAGKAGDGMVHESVRDEALAEVKAMKRQVKEMKRRMRKAEEEAEAVQAMMKRFVPLFL